MAYFTYGADYGKGGTDMFQLSSLEMDDIDVISKVDQGVHLRDEKHLIEYLSEVFSISKDEIEVDRVL